MSTIKANDLQSATGGIPTVKGQKLIPTAWVNFNGTGVVAIRDSENVSSITDGGVGQYTINFSTTMANVNYATASSAIEHASTYASLCKNTSFTTAGYLLAIYGDHTIAAGTKTDVSIISSQVMGGQA
tara:strand:- start:20 stop:403 length:384 start_codon:yes stop_codon:yes gene_type:complete